MQSSSHLGGETSNGKISRLDSPRTLLQYLNLHCIFICIELNICPSALFTSRWCLSGRFGSHCSLSPLPSAPSTPVKLAYCYSLSRELCSFVYISDQLKENLAQCSAANSGKACYALPPSVLGYVMILVHFGARAASSLRWVMEI